MGNEVNNRKYWICCPLCDNDKCVKGTDKCEAEQWEKEMKESEEKKRKELLEQQPTKNDLADDYIKVRRYFDEIEYQRKTKTAAIVTALVVIASIMLLIALIV